MNTILGTLTLLKKTWYLSVEVKLLGSDTTNIMEFFRVKAKDDGHGFRTPALFTWRKKNQLLFRSTINSNPNAAYNHVIDFPIESFVKIEVMQVYEGTEYKFKVKINGNIVYDAVNNNPLQFENVEVSTGTYDGVPEVELKNVVFKNLQ